MADKPERYLGGQVQLFDIHSDSFELPTPVIKSLLVPSDQVPDRIRKVVEQLRQLGVSINPSSRLHEYARLLGTHPNSDADVVKHNTAFLESLQFLAICGALERLDDPTPWLAKIESATRGAVFAPADSGGSRSRSDQFELYVMATLVVAGFNLEPKEPDLLIRFGAAEELAIAAKRPRSTSKVVRNLRKAANQIARVGIPGIIAVDLSFVEGIEKPIWFKEPEAHQVAAKILLDGFALENQESLLKIASRAGVNGVLLHLSCAVRSVRPQVLMVSRRWIMVGNERQPLVTKVVEGIQRICTSGSSPPASGGPDAG